jgi:hypothetical protein
VLKLVALLPLLAGCGAVSITPSDSTAALTDADFDGWRGTAPPEKQTVDPSQAGGILSTILDRVESIEAKLRPPRQATDVSLHVDGSQPSPSALPPRDLAAAVTRAAPTPAPAADPGLTPRESFPPPAPPAELAQSQGDPAPVETLDIPKGWTGAAVYHAATCPHCPPLLAGLRSRATKAAGNYLRIDGSWFLLVDWDQRPDVDRPKLQGLPAVLYFVDGHERLKDRVIGFGNRPGELDAIIARHPLKASGARNPASGVTGVSYFGSFARSNCPCGPACACLPGSQCGCLGGNELATFPLNSLPPWYGAPSPMGSGSVSVMPAQHSAGISLFGMPLISGSVGTYPTCGLGGCP